MAVLKAKEGEKLLTITLSSYLCPQIFVCSQESDGNFIRSSLTEPNSGAEKELGSN